MTALRLLALSILCVLALTTAAGAQNIIERLVNPGPLAEAHAKLEATCNDCHTPFTRDTQNALCISCHKPVGADVDAHIGFHGRSPEVASSQCRRCHTDHKGRDANIVFFDAKLFDHDISDFKLTGGHVGIACASCHVQKVKFREAAVACNACHAKDDPHLGELGNLCGDCHVADNWHKTQKFDHDKTKFALTGQHAKAECRSCHAGAVYTGLALTCNGCHQPDDVHKGTFGIKCQECHVTESWKKVTFDHDKTRFPLLGKHKTVDCDKCHSANPAEDKGKLSLTCVGCHTKDDVHKGTFGPKCEDCHVADAWKKITFDHDQTAFPLHGAHKKVLCTGCHSDNLIEDKGKLSLTCFGCHRKDDVHKGSFGTNCASCHNESNWKDAINFDHDKTRFPLVGRHKPVPCADCHKNKDFKKTPLLCQQCHLDTFHKGRLGPECTPCHTPKGWLLWHFDHNATHFPLTGGHVGLDCHSCHATAVTGKPVLDTVCGSCHQKDDVHRGSFGQHCERCHSTTTFRR